MAADPDIVALVLTEADLFLQTNKWRAQARHFCVVVRRQ
jgi:hypothetical protein